MKEHSATALAPEPAAPDAFSLEAVDVTGSHRLLAEGVDRGMPAEAVAKALAARMRLPENIPWGLRRDDSTFLDERTPIGEQLEPGDQVTVVPRTHLGCGM